MEENKQTLQDEVALGILMDLHAQQEGEALWESFAASGEKMPQKLDKKCRRHLEVRKRSPLVRAALWIVSLLMFGTLSIMAAEAGGLVEFREPLWEGYFVTLHRDETVTVHFSPTAPIRGQDTEKLRKTMESALPQGFTCAVSFIRTYPSHNPGMYLLYANDAQAEIYLSSQDPGRGLVEVNAKNAKVDEIRHLDLDIVLLTFSDGWTLVWHDAEENLCYTLAVKGIRESEFWALANTLLLS